MTLSTQAPPALRGAAWRAADGAGGAGFCLHCGLASPHGQFCCGGCEAAHALIQGMGLGAYYARRLRDAAQRPLRPEPAAAIDFARHIVTAPDGTHGLTLAVDGLHCAACVWLIEAVLARQPELRAGRVNMSTRRLRLAWRGPEASRDAQAAAYCRAVEQLGYRLVPFEPQAVSEARLEAGRALTRCMAVAGFGAGNIMLISLATWFGAAQNMGPATLALMHWVSALIALPCIAYAGQPFFRGAAGALRRGRSSMDVPVAVGVLAVTALSLWQTVAGGAHTYFDGATSLLFFLLLGRLLDHRARSEARATAEQMLLLRGIDAAVVRADGTVVRTPQAGLRAGDCLLVGMGERVAADGVLQSPATLDTSLITGEALPVEAHAGARVFAGSVNLGAALRLRVTETGDATLLAECARLIEAAEQARGRIPALADRVARLYAPVVHGCAAATFLVWFGLLQRGLQPSLLAACAVLIITCPCALALAVPAVQVIATSRLMRAGILLKSPTALERLAGVDCVVFDKTGTLTAPALALDDTAPPETVVLAAGLAAASRHPLCRALVQAAPPFRAALGVVEHPGEGLRLATAAGEIRLGSRAFCGLAPAPSAEAALTLVQPGAAPLRLGFHETLRPQAAETVASLRRAGLGLRVLSGDQAGPVARIAAALGIAEWRAALSPQQKAGALRALAQKGHRVLMVGDGLNDAPCLATAYVSAAPSSAADISQTAADIVFQGASLAPVASVLRMARRARRVMRQNIALALGYNAVMIPLAASGAVTPWLAALAMSASSLLVMLNALRLQGGAL